MKAMGIRRQLMYPSNPAVYAMFLYRYADNLKMLTFAKGTPDERRTTAFKIMDMHNELLVSAANISDMLRPVPLLFGETPEQITTRAKAFVKKGVRAVWLFPFGELPGGKSPAHPDFDPLYAFLAESNTALILHIAGEGNFLRSEAWDKAPAFDGHIRHIEFSRSPWFTAKMHLEVDNFLTIMVMGGVFDRHPPPTLRNNRNQLQLDRSSLAASRYVVQARFRRHQYAAPRPSRSVSPARETVVLYQSECARHAVLL